MPFQSFIIPSKAMSWNTVARKHYRVYQKIYLQWKQATFYAAKLANLKPIVQFPAIVSVHCKWKMKRVHDIDSILFKPILDQLVTMGIFPDDSLQFIESVAYSGEIGAKEDEIVITITS